MSEFVKCGLCQIASTGRTIRLEVDDPDNAFPTTYYVSINDLQAVISKRKQTATIIKPKEKQQQW